MPNNLLDILKKSDEYLRLVETLVSDGGAVSVFGLSEAHKAHIFAAAARHTGLPMLYVAADERAAHRVYEEVIRYLPEALLFPVRDMSFSARTYAASSDIAAGRIRALTAMLYGKTPVIVTSAEALMQRVVPSKILGQGRMELRVGDELDVGGLMEHLSVYGYERVDICEGKGQAAKRGGYVDIYPITAQNPIRIELFDNEIDTMREYDPISQRSIRNVEYAEITPAAELPKLASNMKKAAARLKNASGMGEERSLLEQGIMPVNGINLMPLMFGDEYGEAFTPFDYLPKDTVIMLDEPAEINETAQTACTMFSEELADALEQGTAVKQQAGLMLSPQRLTELLDTPKTAMLFSLTRSYSGIKPRALFNFTTRSVAKYGTFTGELVNDLNFWRKNGVTVLMYAGARAKQLMDSLNDMGQEMGLSAAVGMTEELQREIVGGEQLIVGKSLARGFEYPELRIAVLSEAELYGTVSYKAPGRTKRKPSLMFSELSVGDAVVHEVNGIGRFIGTETMVVDGHTRDYLKIKYQGGDMLYIPTDQLDRLQKYIGQDGEQPKLSKLGSGEWQRTLQKTRASVKKLAFDLVKLYGERMNRKGHAFSPDTPWQRTMEESFPYRETPDQLACIEEIKRDMESSRVMDRLLLGDVGYGKTEVALRAAFKAIMDSKQVIFLVPTTVLALQHYNTAVSRFSGFPIKIRMLSRYNTAAETAKIAGELKTGSCDMVIGTHKLLGKEIEYKSPGLLIIDEEQRFGVGHKEQIKNLKKELDVLTLSATPIPRTLHMSMSGIRDMSVIGTPPEHRYPVQTYVMEYSDAIVREAILKETGRGGQVYFVYNKVQSMDSFADRLRQLIPEVSVACAHGQMPERLLESTMLAFVEHKYDVLLCSTIIESGLDVTNVNTIIIYDADNLGLSQLYQLRGRVGRGSRLAYAYLTFNPMKVLTEVAQKRLSAIREFTQFGSGFRIAMRDLEIRGAGDILGAEQHGFMAAVGYDLYCKLIERAVKEAKGEGTSQEAQESEADIFVSIPVNANIPASYIAREQERLAIYRRIALIETGDDVLDVQDELIDRYGEIPEEVQALIGIALIKAYAKRAFVDRLTVRQGEVKFVFNKKAPYAADRLFALAANIKGAKLVGGENVTLTISQKKASVDSIRRSLIKLLKAIMGCLEGRNSGAEK